MQRSDSEDITPEDRRQWEENRANVAYDLLNAIKKLELYQSFTDEDIGLTLGEHPARTEIEKAFDFPEVIHQKDQDHYHTIHERSPHDTYYGFSHAYIYQILLFEHRMPEESYMPCSDEYPIHNSNRLRAQELLHDVQEIIRPLTRRDIFREDSLGFINESDPMYSVYSGWSVNAPAWETDAMCPSVETMTHKEEDDNNGFPSNISTVITKLWRMYFTLINYVNHPTPSLTDLDDTQTPLFEVERSELVKAYWRDFGI